MDRKYFYKLLEKVSKFYVMIFFYISHRGKRRVGGKILRLGSMRDVADGPSV